MQIMAHLTELMKYDVKPNQNPGKPSYSSTQRPTSTHKPAIYAPDIPPGPEAYFSKVLSPSYEEYVKRLENPIGTNYFDRYSLTSTAVGRTDSARNLERENQDLYFGSNFARLYELANTLEYDYNPKDVDLQVQEFSEKYDDSDFRFELLRQKKVPPTKAYVTLLSLYDLMNKESKRLGLNKFQGYSEKVLSNLVDSSTGTSAFQLRFVLDKILQRQEVKKPEITSKITKLIQDLDIDSSYINDALRYIPPLPFTL
ncbi:unnamed protein product [Brassicogethes aeneus]|uniref:Uncharacterized protein n=1 Tax=Brassicogethes aeneus TaxID=1431903 RepID=A0A9P0FBF1_BRAAE|nr:unnamed protein product [Brassicogethes aeneus]